MAFGDPYGPLVVSVQNCKFQNNIDVGLSVEFSYEKSGDQIGSVSIASNVFDQNGVLVFLQSTKPIDTHDWSEYITALK